MNEIIVALITGGIMLVGVLPGNLWGQVCPQFAALWCVVSGPAIVLLDWMRYAVRGGERPHYGMHK